MNSEKILNYVKQHSNADDWTLHISYWDSHETRFAQNGITQHIAGPKLDITLNVSYGTQSGSATVNQDDETTLAFLLKTAQDIARHAPEDPEFMPSAAYAKLPVVQNCDAETKALEPKQMVELVQRSIDKAKAFGATVSGMTEKHFGQSWMFTKKRLCGKQRKNRFWPLHDPEESRSGNQGGLQCQSLCRI